MLWGWIIQRIVWVTVCVSTETLASLKNLISIVKCFEHRHWFYFSISWCSIYVWSAIYVTFRCCVVVYTYSMISVYHSWEWPQLCLTLTAHNLAIDLLTAFAFKYVFFFRTFECFLVLHGHGHRSTIIRILYSPRYCRSWISSTTLKGLWWPFPTLT